MSFFRRLFAAKVATHDITVTLAAAAAVRRIAQQNGLDPAALNLVLGRTPAGGWSADLDENKVLRASPMHAVAESHGVTVIVPLAVAARHRGTVVDFEHGGFAFREPGAVESTASDPGGVVVSQDRLFRLAPRLRGDADAAARTAHYLMGGDSRAAVVASVAPVVVAAYTDELCAVALLRFPDWVAREHALRVGGRLLTCNTYVPGGTLASDLISGPAASARFTNFSPLIADFLGENVEHIEARKRRIAEREWAEATRLVAPAMARARGRYRDGCPPNTDAPAY